MGSKEHKKYLTEMLKSNTTLEKLYLGSNHRLGPHMKYIINNGFLFNKSLNTISLNYCDLPTDTCEGIIDLLNTNSTLEDLDISGNMELYYCMEDIINKGILNNKHLKTLHLEGCF